MDTLAEKEGTIISEEKMEDLLMGQDDPPQ